MGFELGPKSKNGAGVGVQISRSIAEMYRSNQILTAGFILVLGLLTFWRSRAFSRRWNKNLFVHGAVLASVPALLAIAQLVMWAAKPLC